jgi:hypothetical protein
MSDPFNLNSFVRRRSDEMSPTEYIVKLREIRRILAFAGWSIDDVVNNPVAKREVRHFYKVSRLMQRRLEIRALEKQWNPLSA